VKVTAFELLLIEMINLCLCLLVMYVVMNN